MLQFQKAKHLTSKLFQKQIKPWSKPLKLTCMVLFSLSPSLLPSFSPSVSPSLPRSLPPPPFLLYIYTRDLKGFHKTNNISYNVVISKCRRERKIKSKGGSGGGIENETEYVTPPTTTSSLPSTSTAVDVAGDIYYELVTPLDGL